MTNNKTSAILISVDGNIGAGKSTILDMISNCFPREKIITLLEPVELWETIKDTESVNILQNFYRDQTKYAFVFQMCAYISRLSELKKCIRENPGKIILMERSVLTDRHIFAKMLFDDNKINDIEYQVYLKWFDEFLQEIPDIYNVYLQTTPDVCLERVHKRNREGEGGMSLEYLTKCHTYHENWMKSTSDNVLVLNGNERNNTVHLPEINAFLQQISSL